MFLRNSTRKKLLLFLAAGLDYRQKYLSRGTLRYWTNSGFWKKSTIYSTVSRLLSVGEIEKVIKNGEVFIKLTSKGNEKLKQYVPIFKYSQKSWDGYWRLVIFDIPEQERKLRVGLRRKLVSIGLGQWQKSVYITPFNLEKEINEYLKADELFGFCFCIKGRRLSRGDDREIAKIAFKLDKLNKLYYKFLDEDIPRAEIKLNDNKLKNKDIQLLIDNYLNLILKDPGLPKELLPEVWWANKVKKSFKEFIFKIKK